MLGENFKQSYSVQTRPTCCIQQCWMMWGPTCWLRLNRPLSNSIFSIIPAMFVYKPSMQNNCYQTYFIVSTSTKRGRMHGIIVIP